MQGEVGERLRCHVMTGAEAVPLWDKIAHIAGRLASPTATAEDLALVADILAYKPAAEDLVAWTEALGTPLRAPADGEDRIPDDWARTRRWAAVLPEYVLTAWRDTIDFVSERHGIPNPQALTGNRRPRWEVSFGRSPYSTEDLSACPPLETAALVAAWEPDAESKWRMFGRLELELSMPANPPDRPRAPRGHSNQSVGHNQIGARPFAKHGVVASTAGGRAQPDGSILMPQTAHAHLLVLVSGNGGI